MTANVYDSIPRLKGFLADPGRNAIGALGERLALLLLQQQGYVVDHVAHNRKRQGDLRVVDPQGVVIRAEVKTARQSKDGKWRFLLWKKTTKEKTGQDCRDADMLILLAVLKTGDVVPFVIPMADVGERSQIRITSHPDTYTGGWSSYRQQPGQLHVGGSFEIPVTFRPAAVQAVAVTGGRRAQPRNRAGACQPRSRAARAGGVTGHHGAGNGARPVPGSRS